MGSLLKIFMINATQIELRLLIPVCKVLAVTISFH